MVDVVSLLLFPDIFVGGFPLIVGSHFVELVLQWLETILMPEKNSLLNILSLSLSFWNLRKVGKAGNKRKKINLFFFYKKITHFIQN